MKIVQTADYNGVHTVSKNLKWSTVGGIFDPKLLTYCVNPF